MDKEQIEIKAEQKVVRREGHAVGWLALLLIIIITAGGVGAYYQQWCLNKHLQTSVTELEEQNNLFKQRLHVIEESSQKDRESEQKILYANQKDLVRLKQLIDKNQEGWLLAKVNYLVHLADFSLRFQKESKTALILLQNADSDLKQARHINVLPLRQEIAKKISELQALPKIDITGLYVRLENLDNNLQKLTPAIRVLSDQSEKKEIEVSEESHVLWRRALNKSLRYIQSYLVIRRHDHSVEPLLSLKESRILYMNLHGLSVQAEWALLHRDAVIYESSLQQMQEAVQRFFLSDHVLTKQVEQEIEELKQKEIAPKLPDVSQVLLTFRQIKNTKPSLEDINKHGVEE